MCVTECFKLLSDASPEKNRFFGKVSIGKCDVLLLTQMPVRFINSWSLITVLDIYTVKGKKTVLGLYLKIYWIPYQWTSITVYK